MPPQDSQTPANATAAPLPAGGIDLSAQIPPSYAPSMASTTPSAVPASSALQDALQEQLKGPQQSDAPVVAQPSSAPAASPGASFANEESLIPSLAVATPAPAPDPLDAHLQSDEPDPMAGFTDPALKQSASAAVDTPLVASQPAPLPSAAVAAPPAEPMSAAQPSQADPAGVAEPAPEIVPPPAAAQAYDPTLEAGAGAPASSYPAATEPLPMPPNPLELDGSSATPSAAASASTDYAPVSTADLGAPPRIDLVTGVPIDQLPPAQPSNDAPLQSMLDDSSQAALDPLDPYADPMLMSEGSVDSGASNGKGILFSVGIGAAVLVFGIIVLALVLGKKPETELSVDSLSNNQAKTIEPTITVPDGYAAIAKQCYEFGLPADNTVSSSDTSCRIDASFGEQGVSNVAIVPFIQSYADLGEAVDAAKKTTGVTAANLTAERDIVLGGKDGKEIVYNAGTQAAPLSKTLIVVLATDGEYKQGEDAITSFAISMSSNDSYSQAAVATLEATWSWRT